MKKLLICFLLFCSSISYASDKEETKKLVQGIHSEAMNLAASKSSYTIPGRGIYRTNITLVQNELLYNLYAMDESQSSFKYKVKVIVRVGADDLNPSSFIYNNDGICIDVVRVEKGRKGIYKKDYKKLSNISSTEAKAFCDKHLQSVHVALWKKVDELFKKRG